MKQSIFLYIYDGYGFCIDEKLFDDDTNKTALKKVFDYLEIQAPTNDLKIVLEMAPYQNI